MHSETERETTRAGKKNLDTIEEFWLKVLNKKSNYLWINKIHYMFFFVNNPFFEFFPFVNNFQTAN